MKIFALAVASLLLSACGLPSGLVVATYAVDSASYVGTGKTVSGHALSAATDKDCSVLYGLTRGQLCEEKSVEQADLERRYPDATPREPVQAPVMLGDASNIDIDDSFANLETVKTSADMSRDEPVRNASPSSGESPLFAHRNRTEAPLWTLVLGVFENEAEARALAERVRPVKTLITVAVIDGKVAYRVSTAPFKISATDDRKEQVAHFDLTDVHVSRVCPAWVRDKRCVVLDYALSQDEAEMRFSGDVGL